MIRKAVLFSAVMVIVGATAVYAAFPPIDLTSSNATYTGAVDKVEWNQLTTQPTGTGVYNPFLRVQANGVEEGFNTDYTPVPLDDKQSIYTHSLIYGNLGVVKNSVNVDCYRFTCDINEQDAQSGTSLLSLDELRIYTSNNAGAATFNSLSSFPAFGSALGSTLAGTTLRYDMDNSGMGDQTAYLDYDLGAGSGNDDFEVLIPTSFFLGAAATDNLILYCKFGATGGAYGANFISGDGFEEWSAFVAPGTPVPPPQEPEPATLLLLGGGALGLVGAVRRKK